MALRIHKFPLDLREHQVIDPGSPIRPLSVQSQWDGRGVPRLVLWGMVDTDWSAGDDTRRDIYVIGTGQPFPAGFDDTQAQHLGTVQSAQYVWHVFIGPRRR